jgi:VanZ family protein
MSKKMLVLGIIFFIFFVAIATLIFVFSSQNGSDSAETSREFIIDLIGADQYTSIADEIFNEDDFIYIIRKLAHFIEYLGLGLFGCLSFVFLNKSFKLINGHWIFLIALAICFLLASIDELNQLFQAGRGSSFYDVLIDTSGSFMAISFIYLFMAFLKKNEVIKHV